MDLGLKNKVAFVAASSQGLGKSVALELAREGARIIICGRNNDSLKAAEMEIKATGASVLSLAGDLSNPVDSKYFIDTALKEFGAVDILVTNTGGPPPGKFETFTPADWDTALKQLLASALSLLKEFL